METTEILGVLGIPAITIICLLIGMIVKHFVTIIPNEAIPVVCGIFGAILGVIGFYTMPDFPGTDILSAIAVGIVSGLGATGLHQAVHQFTKDK